MSAFVLALFDAPAVVAQGKTGDGGGGGGGGTPPVITSIAAIQVPGQKYQIYGTVSDPNPANCGVVVTGAADGVALCDASGNFNAIFDVATPGDISAIAGDGQLSSQPVSLTLTNAAPTTTLMVKRISSTQLRFLGTVTDEAPAGLTVTLSGNLAVNGQTATVLANGTWSITLTIPSGSHGNVTATVTDWYGLTGSAYSTY